MHRTRQWAGMALGIGIVALMGVIGPADQTTLDVRTVGLGLAIIAVPLWIGRIAANDGRRATAPGVRFFRTAGDVLVVPAAASALLDLAVTGQIGALGPWWALGLGLVGLLFWLIAIGADLASTS